MYNPIATYRLQFHKDFSFTNFEAAFSYFKKLGVSTIYASPIFTSSPGSTHGYDGLDPHEINPEIGTETQFLNITRHLKENNIGWLQDIVPNHMAFHPGNPWLKDVLEKGIKSEYASFFDVSHTGSLFQGKMMVPFLGGSLREVIDKKELFIEYSNERFQFNYFGSFYPLNADSYITILREADPHQNISINMLLEQLQQLQQVEEPKMFALEWHEILLQFASLMINEQAGELIRQCLERINNDAEILKTIAGQQEYQLTHWQKTDTKINFRRFFTVNGLIALNMHDPKVFKHHHKYTRQLVADGTIQGLRIDHIDGLYDPTTYLQQLRATTGNDTYIVVEKILQQGEELLKRWPVQGNSGYDFVSCVNNLFTNKEAEPAFTDFYQKLVQDTTSVPEQIREKKSIILADSMSGELDNLTGLFTRLNLATHEELAALKPDELSLAIGEFLIQCPVYRYYGNRMPFPKEEAVAIKQIFSEIHNIRPALNRALSLLGNAMLVKPLQNMEAYNANALRFYQRCMQYTGPLTAKGVEDTLMYTYNRFVAHNEVGDSPEAFGITTDDFHELMLERKRNWPLTLNATATHDTKRGEDVRARLNVLSDIPAEWFAKIAEWRQMNSDLKLDGAPDDNDEYFIYQTLLGAYAMPGQYEDDIINRLQEYLQKALREAKTNSNYFTPNEPYEDAVKSFAVLLFDKTKPFWKSFTTFHHTVSTYGVVNSLVQVVLKFMSPGVPDTYQSTELWDLSFVDPDNRRPVDYALLTNLLYEIDLQYNKEPVKTVEELWATNFDGKIKLWLTQQLFHLRKKEQLIFLKGDYIPVTVSGRYQNNIIAFARKFEGKSIVVIAPLHLASIAEEQQTELENIDWSDTKIELPPQVRGKIIRTLTHESLSFSKEIQVDLLFDKLPFSILTIQQEIVKERTAGILMHITSLPGQFGIGEMGPEAFKFADFLHRTGQTYWQILPLNPTEDGQQHSPYSSTSSRAGNTLLISPELLLKEGLLEEHDLEQLQLHSSATVNFVQATHIKNILFEKAWTTFQKQTSSPLQHAFRVFCRQQREWLNDFAVYSLIKEINEGKPWYQWPTAYKLRNPEALEELANEHADTLEKTRWLQFIFLHQWKGLKMYCNKQNIKLFGDLPFYTSYDSVDVWSNPEIFSLDEEGNIIEIAGVPPDHFSADGQLWGMPVFKWDVLKDQKYSWWIERLRKNTELFDLVRLDHFRAFADYWVVPAGAVTARDGTWKTGPASDFFKEVKRVLGQLPFVAEDLGDINNLVYELRDEIDLPGMKVLQFAFGDDLPENTYIPHNYNENFLVYTGTHDNNTTKGWHRKDATHLERENVNKYAGRLVTAEEVHDVFNRLAFGSVAKIAILPIQDLLGLDENSRMNRPGTTTKNWAWRLLPNQLEGHPEKHLLFLTKLYNR